MPLLKKFFVLFFSLVLSFVFLSKSVILGRGLPWQAPTSAHSVPPRNDTCTFYKWFDPNTNEKEGKLLLKNCSSCHMAYYKEWKSDKHSMSQNNPFFLAIYKDFKRDHPNENGNCTLCHNPEAILDVGRDASARRLYDGVDARILKSKKTNGISCDFCHKIESTDQDPLKKGVLGLNIARPCKGMKDVRFGPIKDPIQPSDKEELKYNSLYKTSLYCAKCHDSLNGNVPIYSTFTEWVNSPASKRGVQCQSCHMKPTGKNEIVDNPDIKHKIRPYHQIHSHSFLTENPHEFRKKYVDLKIVGAGLAPAQKDGIRRLVVTTKVSNNNFGHSFPTGSPMRNAILVVEAKDRNGNPLPLIKGPRLPNYAGDLKDKPGKLFAKILAETSGEYASRHGKKGIKFRKIMDKLGITAQDWWNVFIQSDTRIKANEEDVSVYEFDIENVIARKPEGLTKQSYESNMQSEIASPPACNDITVTVKLIWRNTWPGLAKIKKIKLEEDLLIEKKFES